MSGAHEKHDQQQQDRHGCHQQVVLYLAGLGSAHELAKRGGAWFQSGNVQLHLGVENDFHPARKAHPAFIVDEIEAVLEKVQLAGYETDTSQPPLDGYKRSHIFDPFGNRIELMEKI